MEPVHFANIQERAEMLAAKFTGQSNKSDKPQVEQYSDGLTNEMVLFLHLVLHGPDWFLNSVKYFLTSLTQNVHSCVCSHAIFSSLRCLMGCCLNIRFFIFFYDLALALFWLLCILL